MKQRLTRNRLAIAALILTALTVAWSNPPPYPPHTSLALSATVLGTATHKSATIQATVAHAQPGCWLRFRIRGVAQDVQANGSGVATTMLLTVRGDGRIAVTVTTTRKGCSHHESAVTTVIVVRAHVDAPGSARKGHSFTVHASGFPGNTPITLTATRSRDHSLVTLASGSTNPSGNFNASVSLSIRDYWVIVASAAGVCDTTNVRVL